MEGKKLYLTVFLISRAPWVLRVLIHQRNPTVGARTGRAIPGMALHSMANFCSHHPSHVKASVPGAQPCGTRIAVLHRVHGWSPPSKARESSSSSCLQDI